MNRSGTKRGLLLVLCALAVLVFGALGTWQIQRLQWKLDLIRRVDARIYAPPSDIPPASDWKSLDPKDVEYRRVFTAGTFDHRRETLVDALTELGPGFWVLTPLQSADGSVLINRGFVPRDRARPGSRQAGQIAGPVTITGLLRLTEPEGRFLRSNRPAQDLWYSRDVAAIARARGLPNAAPFFIDADSTPNPGGLPIGGLTVVRFRNAHLIYALTWFALAGLCVGGLALLLKPAQRLA